MHQFVIIGTNLFPELWPFEAFQGLVAGRRSSKLIAAHNLFGMSCHVIGEYLEDHAPLGGSCSTGRILLHWEDHAPLPAAVLSGMFGVKCGSIALTAVALQCSGQFWLLMEHGTVFSGIYTIYAKKNIHTHTIPRRFLQVRMF